MECKILVRSLKDSAADSKLKLLKEGETFGVEKPGGEKRIHIGSTTQESEFDSFFFPNGEKTVTVTVSKIDLVRYMICAKDEYMNPRQHYRLPISTFYEERYRQILSIPEDNFKICFEKNVDSKRYYLTRPSANNLSKNYNYIISVCLPLITNYVFIRIEDNRRWAFFLKPEFVAPPKTENNQLKIAEYYDSNLSSYLTAIRTKPFLLLAGISGTGKSRIVRELAFKSCPKYLQDKDGTTPGNYCMIEVKPNWHDSTELLGYYSNLSKNYQFKKFVKFLVKAKLNPKVPFFVCLDEMNLAPVEHYFAEILSIIETRKHPKKENSDEVDMNVIKTGSIVESQYFKEMAWTDDGGALHQKTDMSDKDWYDHFFDASIMSEGEKKQIEKYQYSRKLQEEGLTLPDNVIIIGTVNMDDTTHQFSRKVIDRAMTIEMNGGKLSEMYGGSKNLEYLSEEEQQKWQGAFRQRYVTADEVLEAHPDEANDIMKKVPARLEEINKALKGTPFEVSYRVLNELTIMIGVMLDDPEEGSDIDSIINKAVDRILLMKILPRIEGDSDMFNLKNAVTVGAKTCHNRLEWLKELAPAIVDENDEHYPQTARGKIQEMIERLENQEFTRFWP